MTNVTTESPAAGADRASWLPRRAPIPAPSAASRWLRALIVVTIVAVFAVETLVLLSVEAPGFGVFVRAVWALLRMIGFLVLMRAVRLGRAGARPFGLILSITTVFAVARLAEPRQGSPVPETAVLVGLAVLATLCTLLVVLLYRSKAVDVHLSARPLRRRIPAWVLTARIAVLTYAALLLVPLLVALGSLFGDHRRLPWPAASTLLVGWGVLFALVSFLAPLAGFFVVLHRRWARSLAAALGVAVLVAGPAFCWVLNGWDGLIRDGVPLVVTALLGLYALWRSRTVTVNLPGVS